MKIKSKKISKVKKKIQLLKACFVQRTSEIVQKEKKTKKYIFFLKLVLLSLDDQQFSNMKKKLLCLDKKIEKNRNRKSIIAVSEPNLYLWILIN